MSVSVVRVGPDDIDLVAPLFDAYRQFYGCSPDCALARAFLSDRIIKCESVVFVAVRADRGGVGFTQLYPTFTSIGVKPAWILNDLYVDPIARRGGVGRMLMNAAKDHALATGAAWLELATATDNKIAQALYRDLGYKLDDKYLRFKLIV